MEVHEKLGELAALVSGARSVPLSTSVLVDREQVLRLVTEVRRLLPAEVQQAGDVLAQRDEVLQSASTRAEEVLQTAQTEADEILGAARSRAEELTDSQAVTRAARERAEHIIATAREQARSTKLQTDAWADRKMADFSEELERLQEQARRGRERLKQRAPGDPGGEGDPEPETDAQD